MIVFWSSDPETNTGIYAAHESTPRRYWMKDLGIKMVFIDPFYNHTAGLIGDKWFSPKIGTDHALSFAIAYTWLDEGTYDKEYVATHAHGFDEWADYVLGKTDGVPKTCEWAEAESGVPACEIRALAREWAKRKTMLAAGGLGGWGGACRASHGIEWARGMIALATMQGMGKPGTNIYSTTQGTPVDYDFYFPGYAEGGISGDCENSAAGFKFAWRMFDGKTTFPSPSNINTSAGQHIPRLRVPECIMDGEYKWAGKGFAGGDIQHQMHMYQYPAPGYPKIKMLWKYGGPWIGTMTATNRYARMYADQSLEFVVSQSIWFEGEVPFADIILPACTNFERWDISEFANCSGYIPDTYGQCNHRVISLQAKCIEPVGECKSDYHIYAHARREARHRPDVHRGQGRARLDRAVLQRHRHAQAHDLRRVQGEGLLHRAGQPGAQEDAGAPLVRRGPREGHARLGPAPEQPGRAQGPADAAAARSSSSPRASRTSRTRATWTSTVRPCTPTCRPGRATTARSPRSTRSACSRRTRASRSTPWVTARTAS